MTIRAYFVILLLLSIVVYCLHGFVKVVLSCACDPGFTGKYCESDLWYASHAYGPVEDSYETTKRPFNNKNGQCVNGVPVYHNNCICNYGYTGVSCDVVIPTEETRPGVNEHSGEEFKAYDEGDLKEGGGFGSTWHNQDINDFSGPGANQYSGDEIESGFSGGSGVDETFGHSWSSNVMDHLPWEIIPQWRHSMPYREPVKKAEVVENKFVVVSTGIAGTQTQLHVAQDFKSPYPGGKIYRFSFAPIPNKIGNKSRLELTTCFTKMDDLIKKYNGIPTETEILMKKTCAKSLLSPDDMHTHEYEIYIPKDDFDTGGKYVMTQWHGSADPTILKDQNGCIAQISNKDIHRLCSKGNCSQGEIFNRKNRFIGLNYNQGGYPPLTMTLTEGHFIITARSDERVFIEKGGCSKSIDSVVECPDHPRVLFNVLWRIPADKFKFDQWVKFKWEIKWSEYNDNAENYTNPGMLTSNAFIRVWMDGVKIVDWIGPCGRNDGGLTPYFKIGIYNPSGSTTPIRFYARRYQHHHSPMDQHKDKDVRKSAKKLTLCSRKAKGINQNVVKSLKRYTFDAISSASERKCTLHAEQNYIAFLTSVRFSKLFIDDYTKKIISHLIYALEDQNFKIKALENRLAKYEKSEISEGADDEFDDYSDYGI